MTETNQLTSFNISTTENNAIITTTANPSNLTSTSTCPATPTPILASTSATSSKKKPPHHHSEKFKTITITPETQPTTTYYYYPQIGDQIINNLENLPTANKIVIGSVVLALFFCCLGAFGCFIRRHTRSRRKKIKTVEEVMELDEFGVPFTPSGSISPLTPGTRKRLVREIRDSVK